MNSLRPHILALAALTAFAVSTHADDTDIYLNPTLPSGGEPLVMFNIDYRSNLFSTSCNGPGATIAAIESNCGYSNSIASTMFEDGAHIDGKISLFELIRSALTEVLGGLEGVKVGLMMSHNHNSNCAGPGQSQCSNGGMILSGFNLLSAGDDIDDFTNPLNNKAALRKILRNIPSTPGIPGVPNPHPYQLNETYFELFRYLTGQAVYNGENGWRDFDSSNAAKSTNLDKNPNGEPADPGFAIDGILFYPSWDESIMSGNPPVYTSPLVGAACTRVFVINVGMGVANQDNDSDSAIAATKANGGLNLALGGSNKQAQLMAYLYDADLGDGTYGTVPVLEGKQNVTSYFVMSSANNTQDAWAVGGGTGTAVELGADPDAMVGTISNIFKSILAVSTTFVAPSVPVNVFNRAQTLNEVYLALFEADELPAWPGNLKKLTIGTNALGQLELQDSSSPPIGAIDVDGRIKREAITFWTDTASLPAVVDDEVVGADGRSIKRGGAGQKIPGYLSGSPGLTNTTTTRHLYTDDATDTFSDGVTDGLMPLEATTAVRDELSATIKASFTTTQHAMTATAQNTEIVDILEYARGLESDGTTTRDWILGDPLHSRPLPINFGARATGFDVDNPDIRIVMGTNDGYMHMFQNTDASGNDSGAESWAFMPRVALPTVNRQFQATVIDPKHPITTDGSAVALLVDSNFDGTLSAGSSPLDKAIVMFGQRRGGHNLYALDVIDPDVPKLKWLITGGSGDFVQLAQTWSTPQLGKVRLGSATATATNVIALGGGYNGDDGYKDGDTDGSAALAACNALASGSTNRQACFANIGPGSGTFGACDALATGTARTGCFAALGKDSKNRASREGETPLVGVNDDEGNAIFIINAETGALVWKFVYGATRGVVDAAAKSTTHDLLLDSIPAETVLIDTSGNGIADRIYVADTGGTVWRVDLAGLYDEDGDGTPETMVGHQPSVWQITPLITVGRQDASHTTIADDRRFFNRVDVVQSSDDTGPFDGLLLGSGDRSDPQATGTTDWFYLIKDRHITSGSPPTLEPDGTSALPMEEDDLPDLTSNCLQTDTQANCGITSLDNGWRIQLEASGEKNLAASITSGGNVFFTTFEPSPPTGACGLSEGTGRFYAIALQNATAIINFNTANDTTSPVDPSENYDRFDPLGSGGIPVEVVPIGGGKVLVQGQEGGENIISTGAKSNLRTYWHERY